MEASRLTRGLTLYPNLDRKQKLEFFLKPAVFSVPALYGEPFDLYLLGAMAVGVNLTPRGLP